MTDVQFLEDRWLAKLFGHAVYRIDCQGQRALDENGLSRATAEVRSHAARHYPAPAFYYAKIPASEVALIRALCEAGLYPVDVNVTLERNGSLSRAARTSNAVSVEDIRAEEHEEVLKIAESCFRFSRFHLDPAIPNELANRIKREWVNSYLNKARGDRVFLGRIDRRPAGFLAALLSESHGRPVAVVDLIGVDEEFQNKGVGERLLEVFMNHYGETCKGFLVGTQAANIPSLRLYEGLGFKVQGTECVLHMHVAGKAGSACE